MSQVWELELSQPEKMTLLALADHADHDGSHVFPSVELVAWMCGCSKRTVQRHIRSLTEAGILELVAEARGTRPREYRIHTERGDRLTPLPGKRGDTSDTPGVTPVTQRGDTAMSPYPSGTTSEPSGGERTRKKKRTQVPDAFRPTPEHRAYAMEHELDLEDQRERFILYHQREGTLAASWNASFSLWLRKALEFRERDREKAAEANAPSHEGVGGFWS